MSDRTYNGWSNHETWSVKLWLDNEQGSYNDMVDMARRSRDASDLAKQIEAYVEEFKPDLGASMFADMLNAAMSEVDYVEIAEAYREDFCNDDNDETEDVK